MPRQLKQFLRKRKAEMLACGDCECRTLKCRREATCECVNGDTNPEPTPEPTPTPGEEPSIEFDSGTSEVMAMLEPGEDDEWSNSATPVTFNISNMSESQLSFEVENTVEGLNTSDVTVTFSVLEEGDMGYGDYGYKLTISTTVDMSALTPVEEDGSYFHVVPYYTEYDGATPVALGDVIVIAAV